MGVLPFFLSMGFRAIPKIQAGIIHVKTPRKH
jgi:hypothetical protein